MAEEDKSERPQKKAKLNDVECKDSDEVLVEVALENLCAVCKDPEMTVLPSHSCPSCSKDAWKICEECNEKFLSRICPICRADYAPLMLYRIAGPPLCDALNPALDPIEKKRVLAKVSLLKGVITDINMSIWCPKEKKMLFCLPRMGNDDKTERDEKSDDQQEIKMCCICEIDMSEDKIVDESFAFTNSVWDDLIKQSEEGSGSQSLLPGQALKLLFETTKRENSMLLTPMKPEFIETLLDENL